MKSHIIKFVKLLIGWPISFVALFFVGSLLWKNQGVLAHIFSVNPWLLLLGIFCFVIYFCLRGYFWQQLLKAHKHELPANQTLFLWSISELQRYVPGNIWSFLGRTIQFSKKGVAKKTLLLSLFHEAQFLVLASLAASLFSLNFIIYRLLPKQFHTHYTFYFLTIGIVLLCLCFIANVFILPKKKITMLLPRFSFFTNLSLFVCMFGAFLLYGLGMYFSISAWNFLYIRDIFALSAFFVFAFIVGYLSFITPMGLGVREAITTIGLRYYVGLAQASLLSILARIILIISELITLLFAYSLIKISQHFISKVFLFWTKHKYILLVCFAIILYITYFTAASFLRYNNYYTGRFDLGNMDQTVWNTIRGRIFQLTDPDGTTIISRLAFHADFILILLAPFYLIWQDPRMLLLVQTVVLGIGALFIFLIAKKIIKYESLAFLFAIIYLINPSVNNTNLYDFHGVTLATTFLLGAWYFLMSEKYWLFVVFLFLAGLTKEEVWVVTGLLGLTAVVLKRKIKLGIAIAGISFVTFYLVFFKAIPLTRGHDHFALAYYSDFGSSPSGIMTSILFSPLKTLKTAFGIPQLVFLWDLFFPLGFVSLLSPLFLIFTGPDFVIDLLSNNSQLHTIFYQYTAVITPFLFLGSIYGVKFLLQKFSTISPTLIGWYLIIPALISAYTFGPLPGALTFNYYMFTHPVAYSQDIDNFLQSIPRRYSVAATNNIGSHLSRRQKIFTIPIGIDQADVIVMLLNDPDAQPSLAAQIQIAKRLRKDPRYIEVFHENEFDVFTKKNVKLLPAGQRSIRSAFFPLFK